MKYIKILDYTLVILSETMGMGVRLLSYYSKKIYIFYQSYYCSLY